MRSILLSLTLCIGALHAQESFLDTRAMPDRNLWRASMTSLAVTNILDIQSSWGKHELNSTLSASNGNFGMQGALLKLGFQGGLIGVEYLLTRRHPSPRLYRALSIFNFGASGVIGAVAVHNYTVPRPSR